VIKTKHSPTPFSLPSDHLAKPPCTREPNWTTMLLWGRAYCNRVKLQSALQRWGDSRSLRPMARKSPALHQRSHSGGCKPVAIISVEKLRDYTKGPAETAQIAKVLLRDTAGMGQYVIVSEAWDCIWAELIVNKKGLKTVYDRPGYGSEKRPTTYRPKCFRQ
jgi:hypothetical protein